VADHDDAERFELLAHRVLDAHQVLRDLLKALPLPVEVPSFDPEGSVEDTREALVSLSRARDLVWDEPIPEVHRKAIQTLILEWFMGYEELVLTNSAGPAPWRMDAVEYAMSRFATLAIMLADGELDDDES